MMVTLLVEVQVVELLYWLTREVALEMNLVISMDVDHSLLERTVASENMLVNVRLLMDQLILAVAVVRKTILCDTEYRNKFYYHRGSFMWMRRLL